MTRKNHTFVMMGLSMLLSLVLVMLVYTSLILPNNLMASQQPCEQRLLQSNNHNEELISESKNEATRNGELQGPLSQDTVASDAEAALAKLRAESESTIQSRDERIAELELQLSRVKSEQKVPIIDRADDGLRPLRVTVAHHPRSDMLGAFTLPSIFLLAITHRYGWEMEILPYDGSFGQRWLNKAFAKVSKREQSGIQDVNYRHDYNPTDLNAKAYANLGFFPEQLFPAANMSEWTEVKPLPAPGTPSLHDACRKKPIVEANGYVRCRLILPLGQDTGPLLRHIQEHGTLEDFLPPEFRKLMRDRFMEANAHRLKYFSTNSTDYNVAIHVRRGDVNKKAYPDRWTDQSVYAIIARHICKTHPSAKVHVFSSGKNKEGWATLKKVSDTCGNVSFHLDEYEYDAWAYFVAADALVTSRSTFSYVPALISGGEIYAPEWGHSPMKHWHSFQNENGKLK